jgi:hypothetical protein
MYTQAFRPSPMSSAIVSWLALLLRIREVPASNLGAETGYPEFFVVLLSSYRRIPGQHLKIGPRRLTSKSFPIHPSLTTLSFDAI